MSDGNNTYIWVTAMVAMVAIVGIVLGMFGMSNKAAAPSAVPVVVSGGASGNMAGQAYWDFDWCVNNCMSDVNNGNWTGSGDPFSYCASQCMQYW